MNEEAQIEVRDLGFAGTLQADAQTAAPWIAGGYGLILVAFLLCLGATIFLGKGRRIPGRGLILAGLTVVLGYFLFQNTLAQDAELRYGPVADAVAFVSYGIGAIVAAIGYALMVKHVRTQAER